MLPYNFWVPMVLVKESIGDFVTVSLSRTTHHPLYSDIFTLLWEKKIMFAWRVLEVT